MQLAVAAAVVALGSWWWWLPAAPAIIALARFAAFVALRWPRKLRATALADRRIASGRFTPRSIEAYCGDPCFRVVAREILTRAGFSRAERRRLVAELGASYRARSNVLVLVDRARGVQIQVGGGVVTRTETIPDSALPVSNG